MNISLEEYTDLLKKYEELRQEKIKILNKYYVEKDNLNQEIERLNNIIKEVREYLKVREYETECCEVCNTMSNKILEILNKGE